ncbi:hypothetical protein B0T09DRAFT_254293 [Sordaria sp. MPI-SDFR-AT-0083]|nr:hypothetical protein B0T09DRAFT_254293 [Sordaria sp. MPI-SDFR-AT-0083]
MSRPVSRPNFLQPARSAPAPASVTNTNVTAAMVSVPSDVDPDIDGPEYHDTEHRPGPGSVTGTAASATSSTATHTTGRASSAFSLPFFAGSAASKRSTAPTVSSVSTFSTLPGQVVPVPNVHAQAYTGQQVSVPASTSGASTRTERTATTGTGSSTSGASTTTTTATTNARRAAPGFPPPSQTAPTSRSGAGVTHGQQAPQTPRTPNTITSTTSPLTSCTNTGTLPTAQARTAVLASISNLLDRELTGRASLLHQNHNAILKQEREMSKAVEGFKKDNDKLEKLAREGTKRLKEVGDVQNWAEVLERGFLRVEETIRRANGEYGDYSGESGSWTGSGSWSGSGSWGGSERGDGDEGDDGEGKRGEVEDDKVKRESGGQQGRVEGNESHSVEEGGKGAAEVEGGNDDKREEVVTRDAEGDMVMTTEDDVQERHTRLDKGKGKAVDDTIPDPSKVPLPQSPVFGGGAQFLSLTPTAV